MNSRINSVIKTVYPVLALVFLLLIHGQNTFADYSNPILKVLLFHTSNGIRLGSESGLKSDKVRFAKDAEFEVLIKPYLKGRGFLINGLLIKTDRIEFNSLKVVQVKKINSNSRRRYQGKIEVLWSKKGFYVINHIPTESYLEGVLNAEISTKWPMEVVKAQTIISRTFALYKREKQINRAWHISSGHFDQVYKGFNISDKRGQHAIKSTQGIIVSHNGQLALTFYHSNCGGITEDPLSLWNGAFPYLKSRSVPYGQSDPRFHWQTTLSDRELANILKRSGIKIARISDISILAHSPSGRVHLLEFNHSPKHRLEAKRFRQKAGYKRIQSLLFDVIKVPGGFYFKGKGNGHGVGLSQWSAKEMAETGYSYHEILGFFYKGVTLKRYRG